MEWREALKQPDGCFNERERTTEQRQPTGFAPVYMAQNSHKFYNYSMEINAKQRKFLEKNAQPLNPLVQVGGAGVTENQLAQISRLLGEHELIKVKFNEFKDEKQELSAEISEKTGAIFVRLIGNVLILYRPANEEKDRQFEKELNKLAK